MGTHRIFAAAAEELHRLPSAVSYTISKLEEDLGVLFFDRSGRKAELTATLWARIRRV